MQKSSEGGQLTLFDLDTSFGKMCPAPSPAENPRAKTSGASWKKSSKLKYAAYQSLDLTPGAGNLLGEFFWETLSPWRGDASMLNTGVSPREEKESSLSQILEATPQKKYYLSKTACHGILRRARERGKQLPEKLRQALEIQADLRPSDEQPTPLEPCRINQRDEPMQSFVARADGAVQEGFDGYNGDLTGSVTSTLGTNCGMSTGRNGIISPSAFAVNQRDEARDLHDLAGALGAHPGMKQQTFVAGFSAGAGATAGSIGYAEECAPTLKGSAGGSCMPSVLCLNDQGGKIMDCTEDISGTLRAEEHGHQPLILSIQQSEAETETDRSTTAIEMTNMCGGNQPSLFENHGIDARYRGPLSVAPTLPARAGTGGNNLSLVAQPVTSQVYCRQRVDVFQNGEISSTESARQYKDATDLVCQIPADGSPLQDALAAGVRALIRRLTPLECERLQGFPDGWTDIPGASDSARYRALGNSVAIPCVEYLIRRIVIVLLLGFRGFL